MDEIYVCPQCRSLYKGVSGTKGKCVKDQAETIPLHVTIDMWKQMPAEKREQLISSVLTAGKDAETAPADAKPVPAAVKPETKTPESARPAAPAVAETPQVPEIKTAEAAAPAAEEAVRTEPAAEEKQGLTPEVKQLRSIKTLLIIILVLLAVIIGVLLYTIYLQYGSLYF